MFIVGTITEDVNALCGRYAGKFLHVAICIVTTCVKQSNNKYEYMSSFKKENFQPSRERVAVSVPYRLLGTT